MLTLTEFFDWLFTWPWLQFVTAASLSWSCVVSVLTAQRRMWLIAVPSVVWFALLFNVHRFGLGMPEVAPAPGMLAIGAVFGAAAVYALRFPPHRV